MPDCKPRRSIREQARHLSRRPLAGRSFAPHRRDLRSVMALQGRPVFSRKRYAALTCQTPRTSTQRGQLLGRSRPLPDNEASNVNVCFWPFAPDTRRKLSDHLDPGQGGARSRQRQRSIPIAAIECTEVGDAISAADRVCCPRYRVKSGVDLPGGLDGIVDLDAQASLCAFLRVASNSCTAHSGRPRTGISRDEGRRLQFSGCAQ